MDRSVAAERKTSNECLCFVSKGKMQCVELYRYDVNEDAGRAAMVTCLLLLSLLLLLKVVVVEAKRRKSGTDAPRRMQCAHQQQQQQQRMQLAGGEGDASGCMCAEGRRDVRGWGSVEGERAGQCVYVHGGEGNGVIRDVDAARRWARPPETQHAKSAVRRGVKYMGGGKRKSGLRVQ